MKRKKISTLDELVEVFKIPTNGSKSCEELQRIVLTVVRQVINDNSNHVRDRQLERLTEGVVKHTSITHWKYEIKEEVSRTQHLPTTLFAAIVAASAQVASCKPPPSPRSWRTHGRTTLMQLTTCFVHASSSNPH